jgi:hypothetical protein
MRASKLTYGMAARECEEHAVRLRVLGGTVNATLHGSNALQ